MTTTPADAILADDPPRRRGVALLWQQTVALTLDAYRQLQARKLFWITLVLSTLVAASFAFITINAGGLKILWFRTLEIPGFNTTVLSPAAFYKLAFTTLGIHVWLAWAAVILALISTAGMIPELISDGSIDLYLSKPIGRTRLILTKYVLGLLFVALQTFCFCVAAFFVIGFRGGTWLPSLFWAVPILSLFYSFIYSIAAVVGLLTGSTVAAILVTLLVWLLVFAVDQVDAGLLQAESVQELTVERYDGSIEFNQKALDRLPTPVADLGHEAGAEHPPRNLRQRPGRGDAAARAVGGVVGQFARRALVGVPDQGPAAQDGRDGGRAGPGAAAGRGDAKVGGGAQRGLHIADQQRRPPRAAADEHGGVEPGGLRLPRPFAVVVAGDEHLIRGGAAGVRLLAFRPSGLLTDSRG